MLVPSHCTRFPYALMTACNTAQLVLAKGCSCQIQLQQLAGVGISNALAYQELLPNAVMHNQTKSVLVACLVQAADATGQAGTHFM
mmetsp:Transcript_134749/g.233668  ORF Transcript_134749/g.233668 Transcript_134749/m.233668 type:complete len:86 (+) Transcript_134749:1061-1318(+)